MHILLYFCFMYACDSITVYQCFYIVVFLFYLVLLWFILLFFSFYLILSILFLFLFFAYRVLDMIRFAMFIVFYGDREWMMPLRFIRRTNIVLLRLFSFCYRCFVCWYECSSF